MLSLSAEVEAEQLLIQHSSLINLICRCTVFISQVTAAYQLFNGNACIQCIRETVGSDVLLNVSLQLSTWSSSTSPSSCLYGLTGRPSSASLPTPPKRYNNQKSLQIQAHSLYMSVIPCWHKKKNCFSFTPVLPAQTWEGALREGREARVPARDPLESRHQSASVHPHRSWRYISVCLNVNVCCTSVLDLSRNKILLCWHDAAIRYCDRCQVIKPDRCHHCSACDM